MELCSSCRKKQAVDEMEVIKEMHREILGGPRGMEPKEALDYLQRTRKDDVIDDMTYDNDFLARHEDYIRENWFDLIGPVKEELHNPKGRYSKRGSSPKDKIEDALDRGLGMYNLHEYQIEESPRMGQGDYNFRIRRGPRELEPGEDFEPYLLHFYDYEDDWAVEVLEGQTRDVVVYEEGSLSDTTGAAMKAIYEDTQNKKRSRELCSRCRTASPNYIEGGTELVNAVFPDSMPGGPVKGLLKLMSEYGGHLEGAAEDLLYEEAERAGLEADHIPLDDVRDALLYRLEDIVIETYAGELDEHTAWNGAEFMPDVPADVFLDLSNRGIMEGVIHLEHAGYEGEIKIGEILRLMDRGVADAEIR